MKYPIILVVVLSLLVLSCQTPTVQNKIDLSGTWLFAADPSDQGVSEAWFNRVLTDTIVLPGSMTTNGKGDDITLTTPWTGQIVDSAFYKAPEYEKFRQPGDLKIPFWLQPVKYYKGAAWYQKEVTIPAHWDGQAVHLFLERCHWETRLWVDDRLAGMRNSLGTPHLYDLTEFLTPGKHRLTLCIDNRVREIDPGVNAHSISDHTQSNWNGAVGELFLEARPKINIENIQVYPDVTNKLITVKVKVQNPAAHTTSVKLDLGVAGTSQRASENFDLMAGAQELSLEVRMGSDVRLWNEFHPHVYELEARLTDKSSGLTDVRTTSFGMREFKTQGRQILINGQPTFLRGTLECAIFPKTGYPATDTAEWRRIFDICRAHGLNHMRFHSWCPPKAAFVAADLSGFYLQVEVSSWANQSTTLGDGKPFDTYLYEEADRMMAEYGNHPSFCMLAYGNEPGGPNQIPFLTTFVNHWKSKDSRRIYTSGAGWPIIPENEYLSTPEPRIQGWGQELKSIINGEAPRSNYDWAAFNSRYPQPVVSHEIGEWCVYPNFKEIVKYDGVLKARNFELFQETLKDHGMAHLADSFLLASGKLQALCYKADIEAAFRTKDFGGFQLLDLHDFPGQGTALVGVLDPFWGEKGYITPAEYKRFCNSTVPLARLKKLIFTNADQFEAAAEVAHYGEGPLTACTPEWRVTDKTGQVIQAGKFARTDIPMGNCFPLGDISFSLAAITKPEMLKLEVVVDGFVNGWDFWVYPAENETITGEADLRIVQGLDARTIQFLKNGGSVLLTLRQGTLAREMGGDVKIGFSSIFWNTAWTHGQAPNTLGILCDPWHPALAEFPTEYHSNYQWWDGVSHSGAINLTSLPAGIKPIVRLVDDWVTNRPLALLFEARVGKGKILISGIDLQQNLARRPEARQLLYSLKKYMTGNRFQPTVEMEASQIAKLIQ